MKKDIKILAIETSCDETSAAIIGVKDGRPAILSNIVSSQIDLHAKTGGVVPEVASRAHMESIIPVTQEALSQGISNFQFPISNEISNFKSEKLKAKSCKLEANALSEITHIAVTAGPGLIGSLLVGFNTAKAIAYALDVPIIPVNHIEGHIYSAFSREISNSKFLISNKIPNLKSQKPTTYNLQPNSFPILALTVSGGHTSLTLMKDHGKYQSIGSTRDDAAGEAFDKVAKLLDLGYPGGPAVSKLAEEYRKEISNSKFLISNEISNSKKARCCKLEAKSYGSLRLPRPMIKEKSFDFSFSGLKTAVLDVVRNMDKKELKSRKAEVCAAFEDAVVDVLVTKTLRAAEKYQPKAVILAGGVAANKRLREELFYKLQPKSYTLLLPPAELCGDNAAMIGLAAFYQIARNDISSWDKIKVDSNLAL